MLEGITLLSMSKEAPGIRYAEAERETKETRVRVVLDLDGGTRRDISTGIPFFDHMLAQLCFHGEIDFGVQCEGDLEIDDHHTVEDIGIVMGQALAAALRTEPIKRYSSKMAPMDEALVLAAIDISGRGGLFYDIQFTTEKIGTLSTECVREFFRALSSHSGITIHLRQVAGENNHHICEATFKAFGLALHEATRVSERHGSPSTKGRID
jgi:imidazoleglycerol-phosphate dehydratase